MRTLFLVQVILSACIDRVVSRLNPCVVNNLL